MLLSCLDVIFTLSTNSHLTHCFSSVLDFGCSLQLYHLWWPCLQRKPRWEVLILLVIHLLLFPWAAPSWNAGGNSISMTQMPYLIPTDVTSRKERWDLYFLMLCLKQTFTQHCPELRCHLDFLKITHSSFSFFFSFSVFKSPFQALFIKTTKAC